MGIGSSRFNAAEGEAGPDKNRPMLVARFEEFRKRRNGEGTLSKKKLLKNADEEDGNSLSSRATETEDKVSSPKDDTVVQAITTEKLSRVVPVPNSKCEIVQDIEHAAEIVDEPKKEVAGAKGDGNSGDSDDDEDESEDDGRYLCRGSPSFRIYCIEAEKGKGEECNSPTIVVHQKSSSADSVERFASRNLNEDVEIGSKSTRKRKGNKKKFGAMKTLLKVKSCYYPMSTCRGDDKNLITAKSAK